VYQICLRRHHPKGVSACAAGNQLLPKPALEAQGNPTQLLGPAVHSLQAPIASSHPFPSPKRLSFLSYHPKTPSTHTMDISLQIGKAGPFFRNTLLRRQMAGDRRKPSFPVPDWGTCHKRAGWCPDKYDRIHLYALN